MKRLLQDVNDATHRAQIIIKKQGKHSEQADDAINQLIKEIGN